MNDVELKLKEADYFGSWVIIILIFSLMTYFGGIIFSSIIMVAVIISYFFEKKIFKLIIINNEVLLKIGDQLGLIKKNYTFDPNELSFFYDEVPYVLGMRKELQVYIDEKLVGKVNKSETTIEKLDLAAQILREIGVKEKKEK